MAQITLQDFINALETPVDIRFENTMAIIEDHYEFTPTAFTNGAQLNAVGENSGSCKVFAFGQLHQLNQLQTLALFGQHYRDVLATPDGNHHLNIRQFMLNGWAGVNFVQTPLVTKYNHLASC